MQAYHAQLTREITKVEAEWDTQYARWEQTQADADAVLCVQYEQQVAQLRKTRERTGSLMAHYERAVVNTVGKALPRKRRPFGAKR